MNQIPQMIQLSFDRRAVLISVGRGLVRFEVQEALFCLGHTAPLEWSTSHVDGCSLREWLAAARR